MTDEQISVFDSLRSQLIQALEKKDYEFANDLLKQLPRLRGEQLKRIINYLQPYPQHLALFLDLMTPEDIEEYVDVLPEEI